MLQLFPRPHLPRPGPSKFTWQ